MMSSRRFAPVRFWPRKVNFTVWPWAWAWLLPSSSRVFSVLRLFVRALLHIPTSWPCLDPWLCVRCWLYLGLWLCLGGPRLHLTGSWLCIGPFRDPILIHLSALGFNSSCGSLKLSSSFSHDYKNSGILTPNILVEVIDGSVGVSPFEHLAESLKQRFPWHWDSSVSDRRWRWCRRRRRQRLRCWLNLDQKTWLPASGQSNSFSFLFKILRCKITTLSYMLSFLPSLRNKS